MDTEKVGGNLFVGQRAAKQLVTHWYDNNSFPHFLIIVGDTGSGRRMLSYLIADAMDAHVAVVSDLAVSNIRETIEEAYMIESKMIYLICNADGMSLAAKNSLLKFTEEPPENAYIIMTLQSMDSTLNTLRSRSQHIYMEDYSFEELHKLCDDAKLCHLAKTPGMLDVLKAMSKEDVDNIIDTCNKLMLYIDKVSLANALKSANAIKFKESDKGADIDIILATLSYILSVNVTAQQKELNAEKLKRIYCWIKALQDWRWKFKVTGANKKALYDQMILDARVRLIKAGVK